MEVATKKRTTNFTSSEEELLITLVKKYKSVLECLKTDAVNAKMKKNAWSKIEREFNSQLIETPRTADILKNKYINLKRKVKKQYADEKVYHRGTGGGPSKSFLESSAAVSIGEMLQNKMTGEMPVYDCDALNKDTSDEIEIDVSLINKDIFDDHSIIIMPDDTYDMHHATENFEEPKTSGVTRNWTNCESEITETDDVEEPSTSGVARDWIHYTPADLKSRSALTGNTSGGMCWGSMGKNGLCKDLLAERLSKEQCCKLGGSSVSTSWSSTDLDPGALFFWRVLGDGVPCAKCKGSCTDVECVTGKKCVMRSGSPKCICSPNCKQRDGFTVKGPVCGTDGVSYKSHCRLKKRSCRTRDQSLVVDYHGLCQSSCNKVTCPGGKYCLQDQNLMPHCVKCATFCPPGMSPSRLVCGSDGRTYQSACHLREAACRVGKAIPIAYKGLCKKSATCATVSCKGGQKCLVEKKTGRPRCVTCNLSCPEPETSGKRKDTVGGKVCGSNDKTYHSWCQMFMDACATGVVIETKASGPCQDGEMDAFNGNWNYVNASNVLIDGI